MTISGCDKLPIKWADVSTDVSFPVTFGTKVTVKCSVGYTKTSGDDEVTCQGDTDYKFTSVPICQKGLT